MRVIDVFQIELVVGSEVKIARLAYVIHGSVVYSVYTVDRLYQRIPNVNLCVSVIYAFDFVEGKGYTSLRIIAKFEISEGKVGICKLEYVTQTVKSTFWAIKDGRGVDGYVHFSVIRIRIVNCASLFIFIPKIVKTYKEGVV